MITFVSFKTTWLRKELLNSIKDLKKTTFQSVKDGYNVASYKNKPLIDVDSYTFNKILMTLDSFEDEKIKLIAIKNNVFVVRSGNKMIAVDTQGYDFPRYKGYPFDVVKGITERLRENEKSI